MIKRIFTLFLLFVSIFIFSGCREQAYIIFNRNPITRENVFDANYVFGIGERVYYLVTLPERSVTGRIYIQVFKRDNKEGRYGYKLIYGKDVKLRQEEEFYYTDYFVFNETGIYEFKVYNKDNPTKELTANIVQIR